jgi:hypothetical protein
LDDHDGLEALRMIVIPETVILLGFVFILVFDYVDLGLNKRAVMLVFDYVDLGLNKRAVMLAVKAIVSNDRKSDHTDVFHLLCEAQRVDDFRDKGITLL